MLQNSLYTGLVTHTRVHPLYHNFKYKMLWYCLDLDRLTSFFERLKFHAYDKFNLISFHQKDYENTDSNTDLKTAVQQIILENTGQHFHGKIFILTQLRFLGFVFNPVTFYFCFDEQDQLKYTIAYITNTPWNEKKPYVFSRDIAESHKCERIEHKTEFKKAFHISPFNPMDMHYQWQFYLEPNKIEINMDCYQGANLAMNAHMKLSQQPIAARRAFTIPLTYPFQGIKVLGGIYWQAFKLWLKRAPLYTHPKFRQSEHRQQVHRHPNLDHSNLDHPNPNEYMELERKHDHSN